ncbi:hypothetical protein [Solidesulfovibrio alcoholivorans]|uniref:hypothetical protein n=1 Tax=Solidesulfovibrio alcoholivorans TaxID=81406 RepID=UPI000497D49D|nr:hypothetical protein [Solidesulfovibrio alcoholivorans]
MRRHASIPALLMALGVFLMSAPALAFGVAQGKCLENNAAQKTIKIEVYDTNFGKETPYGHTTGIQNVFDVSNAKVGITPEPGDIVRIAFTLEGDTRKAAKVMNVSKQDLRKK